MTNYVFLAQSTTAFLTDIWDRIEILWNMLLNLVMALLQSIFAIASSFSKMFTFAGLLPDLIGSCILISLSFFVIKFLIGR